MSPEYLEAILLGIVQGIAEFLPISSSGHLVILKEPLEQWLGTRGTAADDLQLNVALHFGTLLSIVAVYAVDLWALRRNPKLCAAIIVACIPAGVVGILFKDWFEEVFATPLIAGVCLLGTAILLALGQKLERNARPLDEVNLKDALVVGLFQAIALLPGISRSGSTIAAGLLRGFRRETAAAFSFLIAVPVIGGAALLQLKDMLEGHGGQKPPGALAAGAIVSFLVGLVVLRWLIRLVTQRKLHWFAWYCALAGTATIIWQLAMK